MQEEREGKAQSHKLYFLEIIQPHCVVFALNNFRYAPMKLNENYYKLPKLERKERKKKFFCFHPVKLSWNFEDVHANLLQATIGRLATYLIVNGS